MAESMADAKTLEDAWKMVEYVVSCGGYHSTSGQVWRDVNDEYILKHIASETIELAFAANAVKLYAARTGEPHDRVYDYELLCESADVMISLIHLLYRNKITPSLLAWAIQAKLAARTTVPSGNVPKPVESQNASGQTKLTLAK